MRGGRVRASWLLAACLLAGPPILATTVLQMNLEGLCERSDKIFRGTVIQITEGSVALGGAQIPTVRYTIRVDDALKGTYSDEKGVPIAEIEMIGKMKPVKVGEASLMPAIPDMPSLTVGHDYLLFTTPPSEVGLSTTVGLGQGSFQISGKPGEEEAVNALGNVGLFSGMPATEGLESGRPLNYERLAGRIRVILGQE